MKKCTRLVFAVLMLGYAQRAASQPSTHTVDSLLGLANQTSAAAQAQKPKWARQAIELSRLLGYEAGLGEAYLILSRSIFDTGDRAQTLRLADSALYFCQKTHNLSGQAKAYNLFGIQYTVDGSFAQALTMLHRGLPYARQAKDTQTLSKLYYNIGNLHHKQNDLPKAISYYTELEKIAAHSVYAFYALYGMIIVYYDTQQYQECIEAGQKLFTLPLPAANPAIVTQTYSRMGLSYWYLQKNRQKAVSYINKAIQLAEQSQHSFSLTDSYWIAAELYEAFHEYARAEQFYQLVATQIAKSKSIELDMRFARSYAALKEKVGDYKMAFTYLRKFHLLEDSIYLSERRTEISRLETDYKTRQKQDSILVLRRENQLQALSREQANTQRNVAGLVAGAGLLLALLLYRLYDMQRKNLQVVRRQHAQIEAQSQRNEWLLKEMNHRVKNHLQLLMSLFGSQMYQESDLQSRAILRENRERTYAIALLHEQLYLHEDHALEGLQQIDIKSYVLALIGHLQKSVGKPNIQLQASLEAHTLDIEQALPIGLIVSEVLTNAFKYAFTEQAEGQVEIQFVRLETHYTLILQDNGKGFEKDAPPASGFGLKLITQLATQLHGNIEFENKAGLRVTLHFPLYSPDTSSYALSH